jgi:hypothetical protein
MQSIKMISVVCFGRKRCSAGKKQVNYNIFSFPSEESRMAQNDVTGLSQINCLFSFSLVAHAAMARRVCLELPGGRDWMSLEYENTVVLTWTNI